LQPTIAAGHRQLILPLPKYTLLSYTKYQRTSSHGSYPGAVSWLVIFLFLSVPLCLFLSLVDGCS
jgi:ABC-type sugar transport system permease subunit